MAGFNEIEGDGRVQRAAQTLAPGHDLTLIAIDSGGRYRPDGYAFRAVHLPATAQWKRLRHAWFWACFLLAAIRLRPNLVYAHDWFVAFPGWLAARVVRAPFVYDAHEFIVSEPGRPLRGRERLLAALEAFAVRRADLVIAANPERAAGMGRHHRLRQEPVAVRNISPAPAEPPDTQATLARYQQLARPPSVTFRLVYQGDLSLERRLDTFVGAMRHLVDGHQLVLVGSGDASDELRRQAQAEGIEERILYLGRVPRADLVGMLSLCDAGIISYASTDSNTRYCAPNKLFEYLQAGIPVLATCQPPLQAVLAEYGVGELVGCDSPLHVPNAEEVARAVRRLAADPARYRARIPDVLRDFTWEHEATRLSDAVSQLLHRSERRL